MENSIIISNLSDKEADINIVGVIGGGWFEDGATKEDIREQLKAISEIKASVINLYVDSPGGDVNHAFSIYNALKEHPAKVKGKYIGWSASAATVIMSAADEVEIPENGFILIHEARMMSGGTAGNLKKDAEWLDKVNDKLIDIYKLQTGLSRKEIKDLMAKDNGEGEWMDAYEAKKNGFVTKIVKSMRAVALNEDNFKLLNIKHPNMENLVEKVSAIVNSKLEELGLKKSDDKKIEDVISIEVKKIESEYTETINTLQNEVDALKGKENKVVEEKDSLIKTLAEDVSIKDSEIEALKKSNEEMKSKIDILEAKPTNVGNVDPIISEDKKEKTASRELLEALSLNQIHSLKSNKK